MKRIDYSVYLVTDKELMNAKTVEESVEKAIKGGVSLVQLREKDLESLDFYEQALRVKDICRQYNVPLIINDRIDIALAVDADGVHIGQSDIPAAVARRLIGDNKILGVSATNLAEAIQAKADGADYLGVGAMFSTLTKKDAKVVSKQELIDICNIVKLPTVIIGGINTATIQQFKDIDIDGVSVVSAIIAQKDITKAAQNIREIFLDGRRLIERGIKGAIFDLDGTILDSMNIWADIDIKFLNKRGLSVPKSYFDDISAKSFNETAEYTKSLFNLPESIQEIVLEWHAMAIEEYTHTVKLMPHVEEYLLKLRNQGIKLAVATGLSKDLYTPCLKANGIFDLFDTICSVDQVKTGKETSEIFTFTMEKLGLRADECIIFEDILPAIVSAKRCGAVVYGVKEIYSVKYADEIKAAADGYIDDFSQAPILK